MSAPRDYFSPAVGAELAHARAVALQSACVNWLGTRFRQNSCVPGPEGGVDCAGFVGAVFFAIGAISEKISVPPYDVNHAQHSDESRLRVWFERPEVRARVRRVDESEPALYGDIVFPIVGRCEHHLGLQIGGIVWHVARPSGVCAMTLAQLTLAKSRYRLLEDPTGPWSLGIGHLIPGHLVP